MTKKVSFIEVGLATCFFVLLGCSKVSINSSDSQVASGANSGAGSGNSGGVTTSVVTIPGFAAPPLSGPESYPPATGAGAPSAPINFTAFALSDTEVNLTWQRVGTGETSLTIWRKAAGAANYSYLASLYAGSNIWTDISCYPNTVYSYQVTADNANGSSPIGPTSTTTVTTQASIANTTLMPTNFSVVSTTSTLTTLNWTSATSVVENGNTVSVGGNWEIQRSTNGGSFLNIALITAIDGAMTYVDSPVLPSTTYTYRIRNIGNNTGDYTPPATLITPARPAGIPAEPQNVSATITSPTTLTVNWTDTNNGEAAYDVEIANYFVNQAAWTPTLTSVGATSQTLSNLTPQFAYYYRVRATNAAGNSSYSTMNIVRTPSPGTGSPKVYTIGPGQAYTSLGALDWTILGPGDTVQIYPNRSGNTVVPYYEMPLIGVRGMDQAHIKIIGMPDPTTQQYPIIDGYNATVLTTANPGQWQSHFAPVGPLYVPSVGPASGLGLDGNGLIMIGTNAAQNVMSAYSPGYLDISNLVLRNAYNGWNVTTTPASYSGINGEVISSALTFTDVDPANPTSGVGIVTPWGGAGAGIYIEKGDHITISNCTITGNSNGIFGAGQGDGRNLEEITIDGNSIYGNGILGQETTHNSYLEGINITYQFNHYGQLRNGAYGAGIKDRGAGTVIRYNEIDAGGHLLDLSQAENYSQVTIILPSYHDTYVYGNVFDNTQSQIPNTVIPVTPIHYGGETSAQYDRQGILHFYNNTYALREDQSSFWRVIIFDLDYDDDTVDARNNIIHLQAVSTATYPELDLMPNSGVGYYGANWISVGWSPAQPQNPFTGFLTGAENIFNNVQNDVGFVNGTTGDLELTSSSQCVGVESQLSADEAPLTYEYSATSPGFRRALTTPGAVNCGAYQLPPQ